MVYSVQLSHLIRSATIDHLISCSILIVAHWMSDYLLMCVLHLLLLLSNGKVMNLMMLCHIRFVVVLRIVYEQEPILFIENRKS